MRRLALVGLALAATACTGDREAASRPTPTPTGRPPALEVLAQNVRIPPAKILRIGFRPAEPTARLIVSFPDTGQIVAACGLATIDDPVPQAFPTRGCIEELPSGVREEIIRPDLAAVAIWLRSGATVDANIRLEFAEAGRDLVLRLPLISAAPSPARCRDNECNPFFEVRPVRHGRFTATARWTGSSARFTLLQGTVLAKSFTATGVPYTRAAERSGAPPLSLDTQLTAPAEYALVLDRNAGALGDIEITARWP